MSDTIRNFNGYIRFKIAVYEMQSAIITRKKIGRGGNKLHKAGSDNSRKRWFAMIKGFGDIIETRLDTLSWRQFSGSRFLP